jgi:hypothetical protein
MAYAQPWAQAGFVGTLAGAYTFSGAVTLSGAVVLSGASQTMGASMADTLILNGRVSTSSVAGAALAVGASYTRGEAVELRWTVSSYAGTGDQFQGMYLRTQSDIDNASGVLRGMECMSCANASGILSLAGGFFEAYVKGDTTDTVGSAYGVHGEVSFDASRANTITVTTEMAAVYAKILSGKVDAYTKIHGFIGNFGDMDGGSRTFGDGLQLRDSSGESGTCVLTNGINIAIGTTNGVLVAGACTNGIKITGAQTSAILIEGVGTNFLEFDAVEGAVSGSPGTLTPTEKIAVKVGANTRYLHVGTVA